MSKKDVIRQNIEEIREDIAKYSSHPEKVKLVAVTKYVGTEEMEGAFEAGNPIFGENRVQIIREKKEHFDTTAIGEDIQWHFIGNLQKNKVKYIIDYIDLVHSVNKLSLAKELDKRAAQIGRTIEVLLEVNVSGEESKEGYTVESLYKEIEELVKLKNIRYRGLMTMAPYSEDEEMIRGVFRGLRELKEELNTRYFEGQMTELSMGMTNDYRIALEEGSTIIRIGSKIFS
ncbi:YggS family pyridoxal phosphate enzyme [Propionigenium maris DSM 9537]|uniref:Pyridoxal phosphate homeostasis protein n=1 Tax=Propionigenium maris DSM 9537 TaxID=1123000 RepID=A0A9W6GKX5_9FUSO|nr:YggS family pyridoxal phosphate-dependent enzyme [Propionigenium maris]GLI55641.1 YggS family pyridoxal phosphate enzyme [Propionigenium maris DSM 9537]